MRNGRIAGRKNPKHLAQRASARLARVITVNAADSIKRGSKQVNQCFDNIDSAVPIFTLLKPI